MAAGLMCLVFFFFNDTATTEIYTLSLHDALPIWRRRLQRLHVGRHARRDDRAGDPRGPRRPAGLQASPQGEDRKSTRLNSSHANISYAVFCLKKKITDLHLHLKRQKLHMLTWSYR